MVLFYTKYTFIACRAMDMIVEFVFRFLHGTWTWKNLNWIYRNQIDHSPSFLDVSFLRERSYKAGESGKYARLKQQLEDFEFIRDWYRIKKFMYKEPHLQGYKWQLNNEQTWSLYTMRGVFPKLLNGTTPNNEEQALFVFQSNDGEAEIRLPLQQLFFKILWLDHRFRGRQATGNLYLDKKGHRSNFCRLQNPCLKPYIIHIADPYQC